MKGHNKKEWLSKSFFRERFLLKKVLLIVLFLVVLSWSVKATAVYDPSKDRIGIFGAVTENLEHINNTLFVNGSRPVGAVFESLSPTRDIYITYKTIVVNQSTTNLSLGHPTNFSYGRVLRLNGSSVIHLSSKILLLNITNFNITSWDNTSDTQDFITSKDVPRGNIGGGVQRVFIKNATAMYLGNSTWTTYCMYGLCSTSLVNNTIVKDSKFIGLYAVYLNSLNGYGNNSLITNNVFLNNWKGLGLFRMFSTNVSKNNISLTASDVTNNRPTYFFNSVGISMERGYNTRIFSNSIENVYRGIHSYSATNRTFFYKNNILGNYSKGTVGISLYYNSNGGTIHTQVYNNTINNTYIGIYLVSRYTKNNDINITNNFIKNTDVGIRLQNATNIRVYNNTIYNSTSNLDTWDVGIYVTDKSENINIWQNNFSQLTTTGILMTHIVNNISIKDNSFDFVPLSERNRYKTRDWGQPTSVAIQATQVYKIWFYEVFTDITSLPESNIHWVRQVSPRNISISGNTFDKDTIVYLWTQKYDNHTLVHDLDPSTYWFRSFQAPAYLLDRNKLWISNRFNNLTSIDGSTTKVLLKEMGINFEPSGTVSSIFQQARLNYTVARTYMSFKNANKTHSQNISLFNISSYTIINISNGTVLTTNSPATFNFSLAPLRKVYAIDKINLDESVSLTHMLSSDGSVIAPSIWFTSSSNVLKKIASNLSSSVPATISLNVAGCNLKNIVINYPDGTSKNLFDYSYRCESSIVTVQNVPIQPSSNSNEIRIEYWMQETNPYAGGSSGSESTTTITTTSLLVTTTLTPLQSTIQEKAKEAVQQAIANIKMYPALWVIILIFLLFMLYKPFNKERKIVYTILSVITLILFFWKYDFIFNKASYYVYNTLPSLILKLPLFLQFNVNSISHLPSIIIIVLMALILYIIKKIVVMTK